MKYPITRFNFNYFLAVLLFSLIHYSAKAQEELAKSGASAQKIADKLANPVASLISVPLQNNLNYGIGTYNGVKYTVNVQPVIPFKLNDNLNLISRWILPIVGFRYLIARKFKLKMSVDITKDFEEWAYFIVFSSNWFR